MRAYLAYVLVTMDETTTAEALEAVRARYTDHAAVRLLEEFSVPTYKPEPEG